MWLTGGEASIGALWRVLFAFIGRVCLTSGLANVHDRLLEESGLTGQLAFMRHSYIPCLSKLRLC